MPNPSLPRISYAQNAEDVLLDRLFGRRETGTYVSIGAHHPVNDSDTRWWYERGWRGVNVEPLAERIALFEAGRPGDRNLHCAIGAEDGEATLHVVLDALGLTTLDPDQAATYRRDGRRVETRTVAVRSLRSLVRQHSLPAPTFLSIDVEGLEYGVLAGAPLAEGWLPEALVIEATAPGSLVPTWHAWEPLIGPWYVLAASTGVNRIYLRGNVEAEVRDRLAYHACALDQFVRFDHHWLQSRYADVVRRLDELAGIIKGV